MRKPCYVLFVLAFLVLLAVGCQTTKEEATPTPIPTPIVAEKQTYTVQRGRVQRFLEFSARVSPVKEQELFFKNNGYVKKIYVERNGLVQAGDIIAELELEAVLNQLAQTKVNLEKAQLALEEAKAGLERNLAESARSLQIKELQLEKFKTQSPKWSVESARLKLDEAKEKLEKARQPTTELEIAEARLAVMQAEATLAEVQEALAKVKAGPTVAELASAEAALKAAQEKYEMLAAGADLDAIEQARLRLDQARNSLWSAQASRDSICGAAERGAATAAACDSANASVANAEIAVKLAEIAYQKAQEPPSEADLASAAAQVEKLREALEELRKKPTPAEIAKAEARVQQAEIALTKARENLAEIEASASEADLFKATAKMAELKAAELNYYTAEANYQAALQKLEAFEFDLKIMEEDLALARLRHSWLEKGVDPRLEKAVEQAQLDVERLEEQVNRGRIIAPFDGVVTTMAIAEGREAKAFNRAVIVADFTEVELAAQLGDKELTWLEVDMPVTVTLSSYPGVEWPGRIKELPYPYSKGGSEAKLDTADPYTHIELNDPDVQLKEGDSAKVRVLLEESYDTLWLPPQAVRTFEGRNFVVVEADGRQRRIDIKIGVKGEDRIEILEGLKEGQVVISQ